MNYQDYIWDLGGTLLDNYETSTAAFVETLADFSLEKRDHDEVYKALKISTAYAIEQFAPNIENFLQIYKKNEARELEIPVLFDGAESLLQRIVAKGGRNFLVSHRDNQVLTILERTQIAPFFTEIVTADNGFQRKPSPESMLYLREKYHIHAGLVIGDRLIDIQAGRAAGLEAYLFDNMKDLERFIKI